MRLPTTSQHTTMREALAGGSMVSMDSTCAPDSYRVACSPLPVLAVSFPMVGLIAAQLLVYPL
jgi:hypothetical protein